MRYRAFLNSYTNSAVINSELEVTVWLVKFPQLRLVLKFSF